MKYDFYTRESSRRQERIVRAQQVLFGRILRGIHFESALEIGPGYGGFAHYCSTNGVEYLAIEENPSLAAALRAKGFDVQAGTALGLERIQRSFDLVFASHVIEHLGAYGAVTQVIGRALDRLSPGGHLVLLFPDVAWSPVNFFNDYTHTFPATLTSVRRMIVDLGGRCVRSGHYLGRWLNGWRALWLAHRLLPTFLMPYLWTERIDCLFAVHGYCVIQRMASVDSARFEGSEPNPESHNVKCSSNP